MYIKYKILNILNKLFLALWFIFLVLEFTDVINGTGYSLTMFALKLVFEIHRNECDLNMTEEAKSLNNKLSIFMILFILGLLVLLIFLYPLSSQFLYYVIISALISLLICRVLSINPTQKGGII